MADKLPRNKVQGGWARSNPSHRDTFKFNSKDHKFDSNELVNHADKFAFQNVVLAKEPTQREINSSGEYLISSEPNGPSKLILKVDFIDQDNCEWIFQQLLGELQWHQHEVKRKGSSYLQPRMTAWIGDVPYSYSGITHNCSSEWSPLLSMLKDTIESQTGRMYNSVLANLYRDGHDHVPWHCDDEPEFGSHPSIASLSFGESRMFELRRKPFGEHLVSGMDEIKDSDYLEYIKVPLNAGTLVLMEGATQLDWQHRIPREYHDRKPRINLTFRFLTAEWK